MWPSCTLMRQHVGHNHYITSLVRMAMPPTTTPYPLTHHSSFSLTPMTCLPLHPLPTSSSQPAPPSPPSQTGYTPFPSGYTSSTATHSHIPAGAVSSPNQTQQRVSDCSFAFGAKAS